jgi:AmiR/NasT family two-component response regulator
VRQPDQGADRDGSMVSTVGYLMAAHGVDAVTAFNLLRRVARYQRRKVAEVAQHVLDAGTLP